MYYVYEIKLQDITRYIGYTKDPERRLKEHCNDSYNPNSKAYNKAFYQFLRSIYKDKKDGSEAIKSTFSIVYKNSKKVEAKRRELYIIINDYWGLKQLIQKVPSISDR